MDCISCSEQGQSDDDKYQGDDQEDEDDAAEFCEQIYTGSEKCEEVSGARLPLSFAVSFSASHTH